MKRKGCLLCRIFMWQSLSQPQESFVSFLMAGIPSQLWIGCSRSGEPTDECIVAVLRSYQQQVGTKLPASRLWLAPGS